jgi:excisionase family DNA binding protein
VTEDAVMTIRDVAKVLKLAEKTVYAMAQEGDLPAFKVRGQWRVRRVDFDAWLAKQVSGSSSAQSGPLDEGAIGGVTGNLALAPDPGPVGAAPMAPSHLAVKLSQEKLHERLLESLGPSVIRAHGLLSSKPFEIDLSPPLPQRVRVYIYNATEPPGGRPLGEHKVQLIVPGQRRGMRASFDHGDGRIVLLMGYSVEEDVFALWDAGLYSDFAWSRNVQIKAKTIIEASGGKVAIQQRQLRPKGSAPMVETVLAVKPRLLVEAITKRMDLTRARLLRD